MPKQSWVTLMHSITTPLPTIWGILEGLTTVLFNVIRQEWRTEEKKQHSRRHKGSGWRIKTCLSNYCKAESWKTSDGQIKNKCSRWEQCNMNRLYSVHPCDLWGEANWDPLTLLLLFRIRAENKGTQKMAIVSKTLADYFTFSEGITSRSNLFD